MVPIAFEMDGDSVKINGVEVGPACRSVDVSRDAWSRVSMVKLELYANPVTVAPHGMVQDVSGSVFQSED